MVPHLGKASFTESTDSTLPIQLGKTWDLILLSDGQPLEISNCERQTLNVLAPGSSFRSLSRVEWLWVNFQVSVEGMQEIRCLLSTAPS